MPARQHGLALSDVFARLNHILARRRRAQHFNLSRARGLRMLDHHNRVRAPRQHAAGVDQQRLAHADVQCRRLAHLELAALLHECRQ